MTSKPASVTDLLADVREQARKTLQERLLARVSQDVRSQLLPAVTGHVRGLSDAQIVMWITLLDHQEPS